MKSLFIVWLRDIGRENIVVAGGKGSNLAELYNTEFPVPNAFVVTAQAFKHFLEETGLDKKIFDRLNEIDYSDNESLQEKTRLVREMILESEMPKDIGREISRAYRKLSSEFGEKEGSFVAIRSSATAEDLPEASFAGQQETFLNVRGEKEVLKNVQKAWASLYTARATFYRKNQGFPHEKVFIAIVVQRMVNSEIAGVVFTADPSGRNNNIQIEAAYGLGEAVVAGKATPDHYVVDKQNLKILEKKIFSQEKMMIRNKQGENEWIDVPIEDRRKQKLSNEKIVELAKISKRIEEHYNFPQDIEWALEKNKLFIVQTRAITTLEKKIIKKEREIKGEVILRGLAASPGIAYGTVKIISTLKDLGKIKKGDVLVTGMTSPDMVPVMEIASAILTDEGGITSHAAIVSRELGVPAIVGTEEATKILTDGEKITVDGSNGVVYRGEIDFEEKKKIGKSRKERPETLVKIKVNISLPSAAKRAAKTGADGVGLLRAEHMFAETGVHPYHWKKEFTDEEIVDMIKKKIQIIAKEFREKPIWYRTFDARTDEYRNLKYGNKEPKEGNPQLGYHGVRRGIREKWLLKLEFMAIRELHNMGYTNIGIMLPFVVHPSEVVEAREILREAGLEPSKDVDLGIMIETPASALIIDEFLDLGVDFVSFGTNDLTQLVLGVDRNNEKLKDIYNELHPAVLRMLHNVISKCNERGVPTSICGQAASNPEMVEHLVRFGIKSISANIDAVEMVREKVRDVEEEIYR